MKEHRFAAVVLLQQHVELDFAALQGAAAEVTPTFAQNMQPGGGAGAALMFRVGPTIVSVIWRNQEVPAVSLAFAVRHSPGWDKAGDAVARHKAHAIVMMTMPATT